MKGGICKVAGSQVPIKSHRVAIMRTRVLKYLSSPRAAPSKLSARALLLLTSSAKPAEAAAASSGSN